MQFPEVVNRIARGEMEFRVNTIYWGDCLEIMPWIPSKSVGMILCDLPYGITACKWDSVIPFKPLWEQYKRVIKDGGAIVLMGNQPFTSHLIMSNLAWFKYCWIWDKHIPRGFQVAKYRPMSKHEDICVFGKGRINYYPIKIKRDKPVKSKACSKSDSSPLAYNDGKMRIQTHKNPTTIIEGCWEPNAGKIHPTQKPVSLFEYLIKTYTMPGDLVMDNCAGAFTTAVAADNLGRDWICIELDEKYCRLGLTRVRENRKQLGIKGVVRGCKWRSKRKEA